MCLHTLLADLMKNLNCVIPTLIGYKRFHCHTRKHIVAAKITARKHSPRTQ